MESGKASQSPNSISGDLRSVIRPAAVNKLRGHLSLLLDLVPMRSSGEELAPEQVRSFIAARELRHRFFNADLLREPAWDMLLYLFVKELEQQRVRILDLCLASGVAKSVALRWIRALESESLLVRCTETRDDNAAWIELSPQGSAAMRGYLKRVVQTIGAGPECLQG